MNKKQKLKKMSAQELISHLNQLKKEGAIKYKDYGRVIKAWEKLQD